MKRKGFTLIELIVVMAIISILVLLGFPKYKSYTEDARITKLTVEAKELEKASQQYYMRNNDWPRLSNEAYSKDEVVAFGEKIYNSTGKIVELEEGNYYDIDYNKLNNYISKPSNKENYILQNPVGSVYSIDKPTESRKSIYNKDLPEDIIEEIKSGNVKQIAAGEYHSLALLYDGTVKIWGNGGSTINKHIPMTIEGLSNVKEISAGDNHNLALLSDGSVKAWGLNSDGQLGDGTTTNRSIPVTVEGLNNVKSISAGYRSSFALLSDGTVKSWGDNAQGQLGDGTHIDRYTPVTVVGLTNVKQISAGYFHSLVLLNDGTVKSWGSNGYGQVGNGSNTLYILNPVEVLGLSNVKQIVAGYWYSLALLEDGTAKSWGYNNLGQLGDGSFTDRRSPVTVNTLSNVKSIVTFKQHSLALLEDNSVKSWGYNSNGQLGDGTTTKRATPVIVKDLSNVKSLAAGECHSLALLNDGTIKSWGASFGQLGIIADGYNYCNPVTINSDYFK